MDGLSEDFADQYEKFDWALKYPRTYCPTRWTGLSITSDSIVQASLPLVVHKKDLIELGYGPPLPKVNEAEYADGSLESILLQLDGTEIGDTNAAHAK